MTHPHRREKVIQVCIDTRVSKDDRFLLRCERSLFTLFLSCLMQYSASRQKLNFRMGLLASDSARSCRFHSAARVQTPPLTVLFSQVSGMLCIFSSCMCFGAGTPWCSFMVLRSHSLLTCVLLPVQLGYVHTAVACFLKVA